MIIVIIIIIDRKIGSHRYLVYKHTHTHTRRWTLCLNNVERFLSARSAVIAARCHAHLYINIMYECEVLSIIKYALIERVLCKMIWFCEYFSGQVKGVEFNLVDAGMYSLDIYVYLTAPDPIFNGEVETRTYICSIPILSSLDHRANCAWYAIRRCAICVYIYSIHSIHILMGSCEGSVLVLERMWTCDGWAI